MGNIFSSSPVVAKKVEPVGPPPPPSERFLALRTSLTDLFPLNRIVRIRETDKITFKTSIRPVSDLEVGDEVSFDSGRMFRPIVWKDVVGGKNVISLSDGHVFVPSSEPHCRRSKSYLPESTVDLDEDELTVIHRRVSDLEIGDIIVLGTMRTCMCKYPRYGLDERTLQGITQEEFFSLFDLCEKEHVGIDGYMARIVDKRQVNEGKICLALDKFCVCRCAIPREITVDDIGGYSRIISERKVSEKS